MTTDALELMRAIATTRDGRRAVRLTRSVLERFEGDLTEAMARIATAFRVAAAAGVVADVKRWTEPDGTVVIAWREGSTPVRTPDTAQDDDITRTEVQE